MRGNPKWKDQPRSGKGTFGRTLICNECKKRIKVKDLKKSEKIQYYKKYNSIKFTYFIKCKDFIKIGESFNPFHRMNSLKTNNPFKSELSFYFYSENIKELDLQVFCYNYNKHHRGEWFIYDLFIEKLIILLKIYLKSLQRIHLFDEGRFSFNLKYYLKHLKQNKKDHRFIKNFEKFILRSIKKNHPL